MFPPPSHQQGVPGFNQPPPFGFNQPPPRSHQGPPIPAGAGLPPKPSPAFTNPPFGQGGSSGSLVDDKLTTVFVGGISPGVNDEWLEKMFKATGNLKSWKRVTDSEGKPKGFGFCVFADAESVLRALRVLGGEGAGQTELGRSEGSGGIELPNLENGGPPKKLKLNVDEVARRYIDEYLKANPDHDLESDKTALKTINEYIASMKGAAAESFLSSIGTPPSGANAPAANGVSSSLQSSQPGSPDSSAADGAKKEKDPLDDLPADMPAPQREMITREISLFRERSAQKDREKKEREEAERRRREMRDRERYRERERDREREYMDLDRVEYHRQDRRDRDRDHPDHPGHRPGEMFPFHQHHHRKFPPNMSSPQPYGPYPGFPPAPGGFPHSSPMPPSDDEDEEEYERRRLERRQREMMDAFFERERRWEAAEVSRLRKLDRDAERDGSYEIKRARETEYWEKRLREWDDDEERERGEEEFYRDRAKWWARRQAIQQSEMEEDNRDRLAEQAELEAAAQQQQHQVPDVDGTAQINGNAGGDELITGDQDLNDAIMANNTSMVSADGIVVGRIMTVEERTRAIKELVAAIPADKDGLWGWDVRWDQIDDTMLDSKLRPFVSKKVAEYLGEEEEDLVSFVLDLVRNHTGAQGMLDEMQQALDDEAEVFVMKLWRMVIYETESKSRGLS
ncbi:hypothetical protein HK102_008302 [Quaeritorhiza haematococci]|nr:hypothetical protein HK102_008302 [Quaeritorhiza haematococci]